MAGCRCPGRAAFAHAACAFLAHGAQSAYVAANASTSRTSASGASSAVRRGDWAMRTAPGGAAQSAGVHLTEGEPVTYPAAWPGGGGPMLRGVASALGVVMGVVLSGCGIRTRPGHRRRA